MKTFRKSASISLVCLLGSSLALANPPALNNASSDQSTKTEAKQCDREQGFEHKLEALKSALKLKPEQESAWTTWSDKLKADKPDFKAKQETTNAWRDLPAPERMEKMLGLAKEHVAKQEAHLAATKTFYAALSDEQRQIFDKEFKFPHERFGKHGQHGRPGHQ